MVTNNNDQAQVRLEQEAQGVEIADGRMGYDTRDIRTYDNSSSVGKEAYQHAKRRLSNWQAGNARVSGVSLDAATQGRMLQNIQACLKQKGYEGEQLQQQSEMLLYKLVQANLLYHPRERVTVNGQKLTATDVMGNHRELLSALATSDLQALPAEQLLGVHQELTRVEDAVSDRGHAILGVRAGQGRSFNSSKVSGYTQTAGSRQLTAEEQAELDRALFEAVKHCDLATINQVVRMGANLNAVDEEGRTPLDLVEEIIDDEELDDKDLSEAEIRAYEELKAGMIRAKALTQDDQEDLQEELLDLVEDGKVAEAQQLIQNSRSLTFNAVANGDEMTYLMVALDEERVEMAMHIIETGVDVNAQDEDGRSALHYVARMDPDDVPLEQRIALMQMLIAKGANLNIVDENGLTALDYVRELDEDEGRKELYALLDKHGGLEAHNALFTAIRDGNLAQVEYLIKGGADIDVTEKGTGYGVMHFAALCQKNPTAMCKLLIELGADPEQESKTDVTPLHVAAQVGNVEFAQALIQLGEVDVNAEDDDDNTPLHIAAGAGQNHIVALLLQNGAKPNIENDDDKTPIHFAMETGNQQGVALLVQAGAKVPEQVRGSQEQPQPQPQPVQQPAPRLGQNITTEQPEIPQNGILPPDKCF